MDPFMIFLLVICILFIFNSGIGVTVTANNRQLNKDTAQTRVPTTGSTTINVNQLVLTPNPNANTETTLSLAYASQLFNSPTPLNVALPAGLDGQMMAFNNSGIGAVTITGSFRDGRGQAVASIHLDRYASVWFKYDTSTASWGGVNNGYRFI